MDTDDFSCAVCSNPGTKQCSRCKSVRYCSSKCQTTHWRSGHNKKCKDHGKLNSVQTARSDFGSKPSSVGGKSFSGIALVPARGISKVIKRPREVLFPYDEFVKLFNWDKPGFPPCGLLNCGNSCFANVVLQCLAYTKPLVAYLLEKGHRKECGRDDWCFLCEFQAHVEKSSQSLHPFSPMSILSRLPNIGGNLGYGRQEDAHEFMRFAIDTMQSICLDEFGGEKAVHPRSQETTLIQHIFGGHLQSQVIYAATLEECLDQFTAKEWLHGDNMYKCDGCNDYVKAWKRLTIRRAPNILTIALKRFQSGRFGKLNKRVTFPETLDFSPYMSEEGDGSDIYKLYAVVVHVDMLNASFFGHYICYIKDFHGNWYRVDDCKVMSVELEEVLSQGAYMLLYSRVSPRPSCLLNNKSSKKDDQNAVDVEAEPSSKEVKCSSIPESTEPISRNSFSCCSSTFRGIIMWVVLTEVHLFPRRFPIVKISHLLAFNSESLRVDPKDVDVVYAQSSSCDRQDFSKCNGKLHVASKAGREDLGDMNIVDSDTSISVCREVTVTGCDSDLHVAIDSESEALLKNSEDMNIFNGESSSFAVKEIKVCGSARPFPSEMSSAGAHNLRRETPLNSLELENGNGFKRAAGSNRRNFRIIWLDIFPLILCSYFFKDPHLQRKRSSWEFSSEVSIFAEIADSIVLIF
ncbi:Ubiquitin carboxyl-terminal hydrolase [Melia azedarach]|uniref:Ubiquitin carboxyl-terminal hydrolase n=1 Tax=Melia azedarach TaxID=155640 RepID=A0ACC1XAI1_MELAZ|nr:Ubiquitin carboxyl-terminal hydrolase [Melia azedarach]